MNYGKIKMAVSVVVILASWARIGLNALVYYFAIAAFWGHRWGFFAGFLGFCLPYLIEFLVRFDTFLEKAIKQKK